MHSIYKPLGAKSSDYGPNVTSDTPEATLERCARLVEAFSDLKTDMMEEVKDIEKKLIIPAKLARDSLKPMQKAIKKREDRKVRQALQLGTYATTDSCAAGRLRTLQESMRVLAEQEESLRPRSRCALQA
jgi:hypothetical protein